MELEEDFRGSKQTALNSMQNLSMYAGSNDDFMANKKYVIEDNVMQYRHVGVSSMLYKLIDETITNASDQYFRSQIGDIKYGGPVTEIRINVNPMTGEIGVYNNGMGIYLHYLQIPVNETDPKYGYKEIFNVQGYLSEKHCGTNSGLEDTNRIVGGVNGLGLKVVCSNCRHLTVRTLDRANSHDYLTRRSPVNNPGLGTFYSQKFCIENNELIIETPVVAPAISSNRAGTEFKYLLNFEHVCPTPGRNKYWESGNAIAELMKVIKARCYMLALFINNVDDFIWRGNKHLTIKHKARVYFNDVAINYSLQQYFRDFGIENTLVLRFPYATAGNTDIWPWVVALGVRPISKDKKTIKTTKTKEMMRNMSLINGLNPIPAGNYFNALMGMISEALSETIRMSRKSGAATEVVDLREINKIAKKILTDLLYTVDIRHIPNPKFGSQAKDTPLAVPRSMLVNIQKLYTISTEKRTELNNFIGADFKRLLSEQMRSAEPTKPRPHKNLLKDYEAARLANKKSSDKSKTPELYLFVPEGDSAAKLIDLIVARSNFEKVGDDKFQISINTCGRYNLRGVPVNTLKAVTHTRTETLGTDGELEESVEISRSKKMENAILEGLMDVIGLQYSDHYYTGPDLKRKLIGDMQFSKLTYKVIIISTDQDEDGIGNICSLLMVFILTFWPALYDRNFVRRLQTPIVRAYSRRSQKVWNFYTIPEHQTWQRTNPDENPEIRYYKGLSSHSEDEAIDDIARNISKNIVLLTKDMAAEKTAMDYFGTDSNIRKLLLSTEFDEWAMTDSEINIRDTQSMKCTDHFEVYARNYFLTCLTRKIKSAIDGFSTSQREVFYTASGSPGRHKVVDLTGRTTERTHYIHGDASLNGVITKMAQNFPGSNNIPPLIGLSVGVGDRKEGREKTAGARYVEVRYNTLMNYMFPGDDYELYRSVIREGHACEPEFYIPILPITLLESTSIAGAGWRVECWARKYTSVLPVVRSLIKSDCDHRDPADCKSGCRTVEWIKNNLSTNFIGEIWVPETVDTAIANYPDGRYAEILMGRYTYDAEDNSILITELPLKIWSSDIKEDLLKKYHYKNEEAVAKIVEYITDSTGNGRVNIYVKLILGGYEKIQTLSRNSKIRLDDPVILAFGLYRICHQQLNLIDENIRLRCYTCFEEILGNWYVVRKQMYQRRIRRLIIITIEKKKYWEHILRFIRMSQSGEIDIGDNKSDAECEAILSAAGFPKIYHTILTESRENYPDDNILLDIIYNGPRSSYKYIDNITIRMTKQSGIAEIQKKIDELSANIQAYEKYDYRSVWQNEINIFDKKYAEYRAGLVSKKKKVYN